MNKVKPILAIETSEVICGAALYFSTGKYFASSIKLKHSHSEKLFDIIAFLFKQAEIKRDEISSVAVSGGPGSFTGLRIGMAAAKGIASDSKGGHRELLVGLDIDLRKIPTGDNPILKFIKHRERIHKFERILKK